MDTCLRCPTVPVITVITAMMWPNEFPTVPIIAATTDAVWPSESVTVSVVLCSPCRIKASYENSAALSRRTGKAV